MAAIDKLRRMVADSLDRHFAEVIEAEIDEIGSAGFAGATEMLANYRVSRLRQLQGLRERGIERITADLIRVAQLPPGSSSALH